MWEVSDKLNGAPVSSGEGLGNRGCELSWQLGDVSAICDNAASCHMFYSSTGMINYRGAESVMTTASSTNYPLEGYGDLPLTFRSGRGEVSLLLCDDAHVPSLSCHFFSLRVAADRGHDIPVQVMV